jgi:MFS superfamily sulfate permease-like transporter
MSRIGTFLFGLGIIVMVAECAANIASFIQLSSIHSTGLNSGSEIVLLCGAFFQGGTLMGLGRVIQLLSRNTQ